MTPSIPQIEPPLKVYRLYLGLSLKIVLFGMTAAFVGVGFLFLLGVLPESPPRLAGVFFLVPLSIIWFQILTVPHRIEVISDGRIRFVALARRLELSPQEVVSITPYGSQFGFLVLKHARGRLKLVNQFDGFHEFLTGLKAMNPGVVLRGC